ncbi:ATP-binding protein [Clostridium swellfunianum]|uniref:nucleotide-binding protein n=1 Tax=Clostridium swellfunianum TaxID=1367462 RepID=UPI0020306415|nr:ATP-binding protein [Clostridium swellfunianum]MCM0649465.1 ATP-binding protein [Clostridium swellfunianum]
MSRIRIFTGHFGSGKTEISINYAIELAKQGKKVAIVDIDIVNPYFCVRDIIEHLNKEYGIRVISSNPHYSNAELAVVPSEVIAIFNDKSYEVVIDIGGDENGAVVLGQYNRFFRQEPYDMYFVINNNRPQTSNLKDTEEYIRNIEYTSRLKVTHLIANTNMSYETTIEDVLKGDKEVRELSEKTGIPYKYTTVRKDFINELEGKISGEVFGLDIYMKPPWR